MNITRRRGAIAFFITLGALTVGLAVTLNITWIIRIHNEGHLTLLVLGIILFAILVAGVVLNTIFLVREVRRNERQDSFLNAVTHELKTPIASIRLYLETLQRRATSEEQKQEFYKIMLSDSDRLLATVEQVLKAGQLGQRHRQQNRTLLEPVPGAIRLQTLGIAEDLRTAVINVLDNAIKYSPEGVHIRCALAIVNYTSIALTITDTGVGIEPSQFKRIFTRFYRVPGRNISRIKGTGLGLFLVRNSARQHGGDATAKSPGPGLGTPITIPLPLANPD